MKTFFFFASVFAPCLSLANYDQNTDWNAHVFGNHFSSQIDPVKFTVLDRFFNGRRKMILLPEEVANLVCELKMPLPELLLHLGGYARRWARPTYSQFQVGEAALGASGTVYLGVNLEFEGPMSNTVHGEQFILAVARMRKETEIKILAIGLPSAPCQHCRQIMMEMTNPNMIVLRENGAPKYFKDYIIDAFGPGDLGNPSSLFSDAGFPSLKLLQSPRKENRLLALHALQGAALSYAPEKYLHTAAPYGVAIKGNGITGIGGFIVEAGFNHSMEASIVAAVNYYALGGEFETIDRVAVVELADTRRRMADDAILFVRKGLGRNRRDCAIQVLRASL